MFVCSLGTLCQALLPRPNNAATRFCCSASCAPHWGRVFNSPAVDPHCLVPLPCFGDAPCINRSSSVKRSCQNYGPFLRFGSLIRYGTKYLMNPTGDHNFDSHPCGFGILRADCSSWMVDRCQPAGCEATKLFRIGVLPKQDYLDRKVCTFWSTSQGFGGQLFSIPVGSGYFWTKCLSEASELTSSARGPVTSSSTPRSDLRSRHPCPWKGVRAYFLNNQINHKIWAIHHIGGIGPARNVCVSVYIDVCIHSCLHYIWTITTSKGHLRAAASTKKELGEALVLHGPGTAGMSS